MNLLDSWAYAVLFPDTKGIELVAMPGVISIALWLASLSPTDSPNNQKWSALSLFWAILGEALWVAVGNFQDQKWLFFGALFLVLLTLIFSKRCFHYGFLGVQVINTLILLLIGLPVADLLIQLRLSEAVQGTGMEPALYESRGINAQNAHFFYSYDEAHGDPSAFAIWWWNFQSQLNSNVVRGCYEQLPGHNPSYRLRHGGHGTFFDCPISINSRGFRGREIAVPKRNVYRIVCLGESTVFGMTIQKNDKPWPELLEQMINERLKPSRPVEVINAGTPGWDLADNLERLHSDILPLQPDLIISYHGYNGFAMIDSALPSVFGPAPPPYPKRPLRLVAEAEYRLSLKEFVRRYQPPGSAPALLPPLQTPYADCYRRLIAFARTNHIRLALANYSMAINENTGQKLMSFYNGFGTSVVYVRARVNAIHSEIVRRLAKENPGVAFIDTHPNLDGDHRKFMDVVHFTQEGRRQLAENIFAGIRPQLERDLASSTKSP